MFFGTVRSKTESRERRGRSCVSRARPEFCVALSLPLPIALPVLARSVAGGPALLEPALATLQLSFCSGGGEVLAHGHPACCTAGCGSRDHGLTARLAVAGRPADGAIRVSLSARRALARMRAAFAGGVLPSREALARSWWRLGRRRVAAVSGAAAAAGQGDCAVARRMPGRRMIMTPVPDSFAIAMQQWPISFAAFAVRQGAIVGILHFCDAIPGLHRPRHSSLRSRVTSADQRLLHHGRDEASQPFVSVRVSSSTRSWR